MKLRINYAKQYTYLIGISYHLIFISVECKTMFVVSCTSKKEVNTMIEDETKEEGEESETKKNKRPDLSKLERNIGWEGNIDGGSC